jgi:hypothetical protein
MISLRGVTERMQSSGLEMIPVPVDPRGLDLDPGGGGRNRTKPEWASWVTLDSEVCL